MERSIIHWSRRHFFSVLATAAAVLGLPKPGEGSPKWKVGDRRLFLCYPPCNYGKITTLHHHWMRLEKIVKQEDGREVEEWVDPQPELLGVSYHAIWSPRWTHS